MKGDVCLSAARDAAALGHYRDAFVSLDDSSPRPLYSDAINGLCASLVALSRFQEALKFSPAALDAERLKPYSEAEHPKRLGRRLAENGLILFKVHPDVYDNNDVVAAL